MTAASAPMKGRATQQTMPNTRLSTAIVLVRAGMEFIGSPQREMTAQA
jgi:hypothetical protein